MCFFYYNLDKHFCKCAFKNQEVSKNVTKNLPIIGTLFLSQTISAAGLAFQTLQVTSTRSFSRRSSRAPSPCPTSSIRVGGTKIIKEVLQ